jgi:hypothetical protein
MKRVLVLALLVFAAATAGYSQKADKAALAQAQFDKAKAAIEAKDFVIVPDSYEASNGAFETNTDDANFLSYEGEFVFLQGSIICGNGYTNKATVTTIEQKLDKKGNLVVNMQISGSQIQAKIEILMRKGGNYAEVIITPSKGAVKRFSGEVTLKSESKYYKRPNVV